MLDLSKIKRALSSEKVYLDENEKVLVAYLNDELDQEEASDLLEDLELIPDDIGALIDLGAKDLAVELVKKQLRPDLAAVLFDKAEVDDLDKEDLAVDFLAAEDILHNIESDLFSLIYKAGLLTSKEKEHHLPLASASNIQELASFYQNNEEELVNFLPFLDDLGKSMVLKQVSEVSDLFLSSIKDSFSVKDGIALLSKKGIESHPLYLDILKKISEEGDSDDCYSLVLTGREEFLTDKVISSALKSNWFTLESLSIKIKDRVLDLVVKDNLFSLVEENNKKTLSYEGVKIAEKVDENIKIYFNNVSEENEKKIKRILSEIKPELPEVIKGRFLFKPRKFIPDDLFLDISSLKINFSKVEDSDEFLKFNLWTPSEGIPSVLKSVEGKWFVEILEEDFYEKLSLIKATSLNELKNQLKIKLEQIKNTLTPIKMNNHRPFGVEIELCMNGVDPSDLALLLEAKDLTQKRADGGGDKVHEVSSWSVKLDQTIKHYNENGKPLNEEELFKFKKYGAEIVTPKLYGEEGLQELRNKMNDVLSEYGDEIFVNGSCGLHVHHDIQELYKVKNKVFKDEVGNQLIEELAKIQGSLYSLISKERRSNIFCPPIEISKTGVKQPSLEKFIKSMVHDNARPRPGFNLETGFGTIEFRMHEATLDVDQIVNWVKITHHLVDEIIRKIYGDKNLAIKNIKTTLDLMEMEKISKINSMEDFDLALEEINLFLKEKGLDQIFVGC